MVSSHRLAWLYNKSRPSLSSLIKAKCSKQNQMNALVLLSGGIDSSCCVAFYRQTGHAVTSVFACGTPQATSPNVLDCSGDLLARTSARKLSLGPASLFRRLAYRGCVTVSSRAGSPRLTALIARLIAGPRSLGLVIGPSAYQPMP
jgi:hypothetical protein